MAATGPAAAGPAAAAGTSAWAAAADTPRGASHAGAYSCAAPPLGRAQELVAAAAARLQTAAVPAERLPASWRAHMAKRALGPRMTRLSRRPWQAEPSSGAGAVAIAPLPPAAAARGPKERAPHIAASACF